VSALSGDSKVMAKLLQLINRDRRKRLDGLAGPWHSSDYTHIAAYYKLNNPYMGTQSRAHRGTFRRAETGNHKNLLAASFEGNVLQLIPDMLAEPRSGKEQEVQAAEKKLSKSSVRSQVYDQHFVGFRHIEIGGGRDLSQIAQRLAE
jgi:hypothetical protein